MCNKEFRQRRGKRGGKKVRAVEEERRKWIFFSDKVEILERQLNELKVEVLERQLNEFRFVTLLNELDRAIPDSNFSEIVVTNTPKGQARSGTSDKKPRTPLPTLTCYVGNCSFTCKQHKRMRDHKAEAHEISVEESVLDNSVNVSALGLDMTDNLATPDQEAKVHNSMDQHHHSTLKPDMFCPLDEGGKEEGGGEKRKGRREEGEESEDDRTRKTEAHELTVDESMMDNSVNVSALGLDMTHDNVASPDSQEEAKVHEFVDEANKGDKVPADTQVFKDELARIIKYVEEIQANTNIEGGKYSNDDKFWAESPISSNDDNPALLRAMAMAHSQKKDIDSQQRKLKDVLMADICD